MSFFFSAIDYNYLPIKLISPKIKVGDIEYNANIILDEIKSNVDYTGILIFPELALSSASCGDLFFSNDFLNKIPIALEKICIATKNYNSTIILGSPLLIHNEIYNTAIVVSNGDIIGIIPKITNGHSYEEVLYKRWFASGENISHEYINITHNIKNILVSNGLIIKCENFINASCKIGICIGEISLEAYSKLKDLQIVVHLNTSYYNINSHDINNFTEYTIKQISLMNNQAIVYINSNASESTTDGVYAGVHLVAEAGNIVAKASTLQLETQITTAEIDLDIINTLKRKNKNNLKKKSEKPEINLIMPKLAQADDYILSRSVSQSPFLSEIQDNTTDIKINKLKISEKILEIQALGLAKRMLHINTNKVVIGISGGVDSTLALMVIIRAFRILKLDTKNIIAITMPGFATTSRTKSNAQKLSEILKITLEEISINKSVTQHLEDINHKDFNKESNIVYENAQARMRTVILFDYANKVGGIVIGTGDLSEIALGWSTYNGDHISNYNVNAGVPKTIAQMMLSELHNSALYNSNISSSNSSTNPNISINLELESELELVLRDIINTPISPELLNEHQETEKTIGPYRLHDFFLWYYVKYNLSYNKIKFLTRAAFGDEFTEEEINKYLSIFCSRFVTNQYKRSCSTDGPDVFGLSLSPRGGLILPSDVSL